MSRPSTRRATSAEVAEPLVTPVPATPMVETSQPAAADDGSLTVTFPRDMAEIFRFQAEQSDRDYNSDQWLRRYASPEDAAVGMLRKHFVDRGLILPSPDPETPVEKRRRRIAEQRQRDIAECAAVQAALDAQRDRWAQESAAFALQRMQEREAEAAERKARLERIASGGAP